MAMGTRLHGPMTDMGEASGEGLTTEESGVRRRLTAWTKTGEKITHEVAHGSSRVYAAH